MKDTLTVGFVLKSKKNSYKIEKVLGQGSFGITYLAKTAMQGELGSIEVKVAIKEFYMQGVNGREASGSVLGTRNDLFNDYKRKFAKEAQSLSRLKHDNIVPVLEFFEANDTFYYAMEYIEDGALDDYIALTGGLQETVALQLIRQVAEALKHLHSKNMLHLDLKPANIMMRDAKTPMLIDFGLAKQFSEDGEPESSSSIGLGTDGYAPVEQISFRGIEEGHFPATLDIYALGATLFKMLIGKRPDSAPMLLNSGFPRKLFKSKGISDATINLVAHAMHPSHRARIQTAEDFLNEMPAEGPQIEMDKIFKEIKKKAGEEAKSQMRDRIGQKIKEQLERQTQGKNPTQTKPRRQPSPT